MIQVTETKDFTRNFTIVIDAVNPSDIKEGGLFTTVHSYNLLGIECTVFIKGMNDRCYDIRTGLRHLIDDADLAVYAVKLIQE